MGIFIFLDFEFLHLEQKHFRNFVSNGAQNVLAVD